MKTVGRVYILFHLVLIRTYVYTYIYTRKCTHTYTSTHIGIGDWDENGDSLLYQNGLVDIVIMNIIIYFVTNVSRITTRTVYTFVNHIRIVFSASSHHRIFVLSPRSDGEWSTYLSEIHLILKKGSTFLTKVHSFYFIINVNYLL